MPQDLHGLPITTSAEAVEAFDRIVLAYLKYRVDTPEHLKLTLAAGPDFGLAYCLKGYFAMLSCKQPTCRWRAKRLPWHARGPPRRSNENTNGLLRQYFPIGTDFTRISQSYLNAIALRLNQRLRKHWASKHQPIDYERYCTDRLNA